MVEHFPEEPTLGLFLNALDVGVLIIDQTGTVVWANDKLYQLADLTPDQLVGLKTKEMAKAASHSSKCKPAVGSGLVLGGCPRERMPRR